MVAVATPRWSVKGDQIIFGIGHFGAFFNGFHDLFLGKTDRVDGGAQIAMINVDGSGFRELTTGPNNNGFPSMSPDATRASIARSGEALRILNIATKTVTTLTDGYDNFPLRSPRGDLIMFARLAARGTSAGFEPATRSPQRRRHERPWRSRSSDRVNERLVTTLIVDKPPTMQRMNAAIRPWKPRGVPTPSSRRMTKQD
jgi:hypothetical protein